MGRTAAATLVVAALLAGAGLAQDGPLPDEGEFFAATRKNLERSQARQADYAYTERRTVLHANPFGRIGTSTDVEVFEVTPLPAGGVSRRLVERDGKAVSEEATVRQGRRPRPSRRSAVEDTVATLDFAIAGRERLDGRNAIVVTFSPRPGARPETREGKLARQFRGRIWVDEAQAEVVKVHATATEDLTYGLGVVARLNAGTEVTLDRVRVDDQTWLPTAIRLTGDGRAMLFRKLRLNHVVEWSNYRLTR